MEPIRILAIAPYAAMRSVLEAAAKEYPAIELTVTVGDLQRGVEIAQANFHADYDVIVSRGGTAKLVGRAVSLPVIEVKTSALDILRTLKLAAAPGSRVAVVGFANITAQLLALKEVLPYTLEAFSINSTEQATAVLRGLRTGYDCILCDMIASTTAKDLGLAPFLITSGPESVRDAFDTALLYCSSAKELREENLFLRQLVAGLDRQSVVFDEEGRLFYSTLDAGEDEVIRLLRQNIEEAPAEGDRRLVYRLNGLQYTVQAKRLNTRRGRYTVFHFKASKPPAASGRHGIRYYNLRQLEADGPQGAGGYLPALPKNIAKARLDTAPVMLAGEYGTGKQQAARLLYRCSAGSRQPFVHIDCALLGPKSWQYLLGSHNSPLCDAGNTVYLQNLDALPAGRQMELLDAMGQTDLAARNQVMLSCLVGPEGGISPQAAEFAGRLGCTVLTLPSLRAQPDKLEQYAAFYLNRLNISLGKQVLGLEPEAAKLLKSYHWPQNFLQLHRVTRALAELATGNTITADMVRGVLEGEHTVTSVGMGAAQTMGTLDLSRPLAQIDREVARLVLAAQGDNHTSTAKSLGISRTTLWRLLKEEGTV